MAIGLLMLESAQDNVEFMGSGNVGTVTVEELREELQLEDHVTIVAKVVYVGWYCVIFSLATRGLGMWAFVAKNWMPVAGIVVASILGVVFGSQAMLVPMVITGIGGVLASFPISKAAESQK